MLVGGGCRAEENKREKKWDNCNSIVNEIYLALAGIAQWIEHGLRIKGSLVRFLVRTYDWVAG